MTIAADRSVDAAQATLLRATDHLLGLQQPCRLVEGRARDERDDRRRGPVPPPLPRPRLGRRRSAAPRRGSGGTSGRTGRGRPTTAGPATSRRPSRRTSRSGSPATPPRPTHMRRAAAFIRDAGGVETSRVFTRMWLSLIALWSWDAVPTLPPEQILLPPRAPLSVYQFGCWARQTIVALSVVTALQPRASGAVRDRRAADRQPGARPVRRLGPGVRRARPGRTPVRAPPRAARSAGGAANGRALDRRPPGAGRLVGRHPAAVGLVDRGAARARLRARPSGARAGARPASRASRSRTTRAGGSRPASRRCGTRRWR